MLQFLDPFLPESPWSSRTNRSRLISKSWSMCPPVCATFGVTQRAGSSWGGD